MDSLTWKILGGILGILGMGAFLGWYFQEFLKAYLPPPRWLSDRAKQRDLPLPKGERLVVLIADLEGDDESRSHTRHVFAALEPYHGLDIHRIGPAARFEFTSRDELEEKASALLKARGGDVLVWGDVASAGKGGRLRILAAGPQVRSDRPSVEGRRPGEYTLTETGLPLEFDRDFDAIIVALVLGAVAPATERQGHYLVEVLRNARGIIWSRS